MSNSLVLDRFLEPLVAALTPEVATRIANLRADPTAQARLDELAEKNKEGQLTAAERKEYETYVVMGDFITFLQAKARCLTKNGAAK